MQHDFWHEKWRKREIGFHEGRPNALLERYWAGLGVPAGGRVLVPLCGKAVDLFWLAAQGHRVTGIELSEQAVREFFAEQGLEPEEDLLGPYRRLRAAGIELLCGDFFRLPELALDDVAAVYDRAALIALPPPLRERYARTLQEALPQRLSMLLITYVYPQEEMDGPPFAVTAAEVERLYGSAFALDCLESRDALQATPGLAARGLSSLQECAWALRR